MVEENFRQFMAKFQPGAESAPAACVFCNIVQGKDEKTAFVYEDDQFVVFADRNPASTHHFLVVSKLHIANAKVLTGQEVEYLERMVSVGKFVLQERQADVIRARIGFHWPPFNSIEHLHLHVIAPYDAILLKYSIICMFTPGTPWFKSAEEVLAGLRTAALQPPSQQNQSTGFFSSIFK